MAISRLNHAVLYVRDVARSVAFYEEALGFRRLDLGAGLRGAAFLRADGSTNDHDLGLFEVGEQSPAPARGTVGLYHLAWEVETLDQLEELAERLSRLGSLVGSTDHGTTKSLYAKDPDGIEFEVCWIVPADLLDESALAGKTTLKPLDLPGEKARYGGATRGGVGISIPIG